ARITPALRLAARVIASEVAPRTAPPRAQGLGETSVEVLLPAERAGHRCGAVRGVHGARREIMHDLRHHRVPTLLQVKLHLVVVAGRDLALLEHPARA